MVDPIHPGEYLAEELRERGLTQAALAQQMGRPAQAVNEIINGKKAITARTALDLEAALGVSAETWLNLESRYRLALARSPKVEQGMRGCGSDERMVHVACSCTRPAPIALCGYVGTQRRPAGMLRGPRCVVCADLSRYPCQRCGGW